MGLDMYLYADKYVSNYRYSQSAESEIVSTLTEIVGLPLSTDSPHFMVSECVMYWRKANAVHSWFVANVQDGVDECQRSYVSKENLRDLLQACKDDNLEPVSGFFFGSTEKDSWYYDDLKRTIEFLETILANPKAEDLSFYYQSSW